MSKTYCLGFAVCDNKVLLIRKKKPEFQKGKLNGVGGLVEKNETPRQAMVREFEEETGLKTFESDWKQRVLMQFGNDGNIESEVVVFCSKINFDDAQSLTDEKLEIYYLNEISSNKSVLFNLNWLIPYCLDDNFGSIAVHQDGLWE